MSEAEEPSRSATASPVPAEEAKVEVKEEVKKECPPLVDVQVYTDAHKELQATVARILKASEGTSTAADVQKLREQFAVQVAQARRTRRDVLVSLERRRRGTALLSEKVMQQEATAAAGSEVASATSTCNTMRAALMSTCKNVDDKLEISLEEFNKKNPPSGETESDCALLKRRVQYEIDLKTELGEEKLRLSKEIMLNKTKLKGLKTFFRTSVVPLDELIGKVKMVHDSIGGSEDAIGGITSSYLPIALYKVQRCLIAALGDSSVTVGGNVADAQVFLQNKKHLKGNAATELFPLRLMARLLTKDDAPTLCFYFRPSTQQVVAEAVGFEHTILVNASGECKEHSGMFYSGSLVMGITAPWIADTAQATLKDGLYESNIAGRISVLLKEIDYRQDLMTIYSILKSGKTSLSLTNIVPIVQKYLPSYPSPRVSVVDVKLESEERKEKKQKVDPEEETRQLQFKIELDHITYKIGASVGAGYPNRPPHFKLQIREKLRSEEGTDRKPGFRIPENLLAIAAPVYSLSSCRPSFSAMQYRLAEEEQTVQKPVKSKKVGKEKDKEKKPERKKRKRDEAVQQSASQTTDYSTAVIDGGFAEEVAEYFSHIVNRDCVLETPLVKKGHVLMRQILMSVFFVEAFHPFLLRRGVAGIFTETHRQVTDASTSMHDPSEFRLLHHNAAPLHRGREVQLPIHWDTHFMRWTYKTPSTMVCVC